MTLFTPRQALYWEDLPVGTSAAFGAYPVTEAEALNFARSFDPQPFHLDAEFAKTTLLKGLTTSGWHTCGMLMRLANDALIGRMRGEGGPGVTECRWLRPVRPGDVLSGRGRIIESRALASRPEIGLVTGRFCAVNQDGIEVCRATWPIMVRRRTPGPARSPAAKTPPAAKSCATEPPALTEATARRMTLDACTHFLERAPLGETLFLGRETVRPEEIIAFARLYDPQPFHLSEAAGRASIFGGLAASGWHTAAMWMRHMVRAQQEAAESFPPEERAAAITGAGPSPGYTNLQWRRPVLAGDELCFFSTPLELIDLPLRPDWGMLRSRNEAVNQRGEVAMRFTATVMLKRRAT